MSQEELKSQKLKYFAEKMTKIIRRNSDLNVTKLQISGTDVTADATELNKLDGVTVGATDINKLANIDALLGFILTLPPSLYNEEKQQQQRDGQPDNFIFVDLCGAPGGFSEYILYRHVHPATNTHKGIDQNHVANNVIPCYGFGMSLIGSNADGKGANWSLEHLKRYHLDSNDTLNTKNSSGASHQKLHYHVCNGADGTGSIYNWDNVLQLQRDMTMALGHAKEATTSPQLANLVVAT